MDDLSPKNDSEPTDSRLPTKFSKFRIIKNIVVINVFFFTTFLAYDSLSMLQSTMNHEGGIGVICQAIVYACFCVSSLLLPKYVTKKLGCKITLVLSMGLYLPYIASNLYPHWAFMVPTAVINGLVASLLWGCNCIYLNEMAVQYADLLQEKKSVKTISKSYAIENSDYMVEINLREPTISYSEKQDFIINPTYENLPDKLKEIRLQDLSSKAYHESPSLETNVCSKDDKSKVSSPTSYFTLVHRKRVEDITSKVFGISGLAYLSTHLFSNVMSFFILQTPDPSPSNISLGEECVCGARFCNIESDCLIQSLQEPSYEHRALLTGVCLSLGFVSVFLLAILLDSLNDRKRNVKFSFEFAAATLKHCKKKKQILLIPISLYVGMIQGFYTGDYNMSYVGCAWGTHHVPLVTICYGAACSISSLSGCLVKAIGRPPILLLAAVINFTAQILLLTWVPSAETPVMFFIVAGLWGTSVGALWSQVKALYGFLFKKDEEAAFGAYHMWYSLGFSLSFAYSSHLCMYVKIYILMPVLALGIIGYVCVEIMLRKTNKKLEK